MTSHTDTLMRGITFGSKVHAVPTTTEAHAVSLCGQVAKVNPLPWAETSATVACATCTKLASGTSVPDLTSQPHPVSGVYVRDGIAYIPLDTDPEPVEDDEDDSYRFDPRPRP
jgi:hypothetical protein